MSTVAIVLVGIGWYFARQAKNKDVTINQLGQDHEKTQFALDEEDFFDSHHATGDGPRKLTQKLARRIEPLLQELNASR